jgi:catechol 2,3-dioxygenase-like lactoylglutathione lyase family enzyme
MWGRKNFYFGDNIAVAVRSLDNAVAWYREKLGLQLSPHKLEDCDALLVLSKEDETGLALVVITAGETRVMVDGHPILFSNRLEACREEFASRGVQVGPLQRDSGGNSFFKFQDIDGNIIEDCV